MWIQDFFSQRGRLLPSYLDLPEKLFIWPQHSVAHFCFLLSEKKKQNRDVGADEKIRSERESIKGLIHLYGIVSKNLQGMKSTSCYSCIFMSMGSKRGCYWCFFSLSVNTCIVFIHNIKFSNTRQRLHILIVKGLFWGKRSKSFIIDVERGQICFHGTLLQGYVPQFHKHMFLTHLSQRLN